MIEFSFSKLLLLAVIALVVLGPEKLPKAARMAGAMLRRVRLGWESVRSEVERELEIEEIRRAAKQAAERAESMQDAARKATQSAQASVKDTVAGITHEAGDKATEEAAGEPRDGQS